MTSSTAGTEVSLQVAPPTLVMPTKPLTDYTALIRTYNSAGTLHKTLDSLFSQTQSPKSLVIVDNGSTDSTLQGLPTNAVVHQYEGQEFNYSDAINQGLSFVETPLVMIISSHTRLTNPIAVEYAINLLTRDHRLGAASFSPDSRGEPPCSDRPGEPRHEVVDAQTFTGFNGLFNTVR